MNFRGYASGGFLECQRNVVAEIGAALPARAAPAPARAAERLVEAEKIAENVLELVENRGIESADIKSTAAETGAAVAIVNGALLLVRKDAVRLAALPEFLLGELLVLGIAVRMPLQRSFAVRGLDLLRRRVPLHAENFVIIHLIGIRHNCWVPPPGVRRARGTNLRGPRIAKALPSVPSADAYSLIVGFGHTRGFRFRFRGHAHHRGAQHSPVKQISGLQLANDDPVGVFAGFDPFDGVMEVRIKFLIQRLDADEPLLGESLPELPPNQLETFAVFEIRRVARLRKRAVESVQHRKQTLDQRFGGALALLHALFFHALPEVFKIGLAADQRIHQLFLFSLQLLHRIGSALRLLSSGLRWLRR